MTRGKKIHWAGMTGGAIGMTVMIYGVDPYWGEGALGAGLECGLGWFVGHFAVALICKAVFPISKELGESEGEKEQGGEE